MGLFDKLFGRKRPKFESPEQLRNALIEAAVSGNRKVFEELCTSHRIDIDRHCESWAAVPEALRKDKEALAQFANGLIAMGIALANTGQPKLLEQLQGGGGQDNPFTKWERVFNEANSLISKMDYEGARSLLENRLVDTRDLIGTGADRFRSISYGLISQCRFHVGEIESSIVAGRNALEICERIGDLDGVNAYLQTLMEIRRYQGDAAESAILLDRLAALSGQMNRPEDAQRWSRRASITRAGEPLCRIVLRIGNQLYEQEDAPVAQDQRVGFEFCRNRGSLGRCAGLVQKGREAGGADDPKEALSLFRQAADVDPFDPDPHYQAGVALMALGRPEDAAEELRATEERAPGWFQCRSDLWLVEQIALGTFPLEVHQLMRVLEDSSAPPRDKRSLAEAALQRFATLAPVHHQHGRALLSLGQKDQAASAFRRGLEVAAEPDIRTRLRVDLAALLELGEQRTSLLKQAVDLKGNLVAAAQARYLLQCGV